MNDRASTQKVKKKIVSIEVGVSQTKQAFISRPQCIEMFLFHTFKNKVLRHSLSP